MDKENSKRSKTFDGVSKRAFLKGGQPEHSETPPHKEADPSFRKRRWIPTPFESIDRLRNSFEANVRAQEELEAKRDRLRILFDAVSDCVFLFQAGRLILMNRQARALVDTLECGKETLLRQLYESGGRVMKGAPIQLTVDRPSSSPIVLLAHSCVPMELEEGRSLLITALDLSWAVELGERIIHSDREERKRISRDLHDGLSQLLASLSLQAKALEIRHRGTAKETAYTRIAALSQNCMDIGTRTYREFNEI